MIVRIYRLRWSIDRENSQSNSHVVIAICRLRSQPQNYGHNFQVVIKISGFAIPIPRLGTKSRNPWNGAAILAVPRLNLLARPEAATKREGFGWPRAISARLSAVSLRCYIYALTTDVPASALRLHSNLTVIADEEAAPILRRSGN